MTMHEMLFFIDAEHRAFVARASNPGPQCWPTWEQTHLNLRLNRDAFPNDSKPYNSFNRQFKVALERGWVEAGPCQHRCHATHIRLTTLGAEMLAAMNEHGCKSEKVRDCAIRGLTLRQRDEAA